MIKRILGVVIACYLLSSCKPLNPSIMFKTPKGYEYDNLIPDTTREYIIAPNDLLTFTVFTNNGIRILNLESGNNQQQLQQQLNQGISYLVEFDGFINLPLIGRIEVAGKTLREAEFYIEELFGKDDLIDPFALLQIVNRRVTIFTGNGGNGTVITLQNNNVKLLEALALAGGIDASGRSARVKLIRGDLSNPEVFLIDLSTIQGIKDSDIILQANDIIYVEPLGVTTRQILGEISPVFSFIVSTITLYFVIQSIEKN